MIHVLINIDLNESLYVFNIEPLNTWNSACIALHIDYITTTMSCLPIAACPSNWQDISGVCYRKTTFQSSFAGAEDFCVKNGAALATMPGNDIKLMYQYM